RLLIFKELSPRSSAFCASVIKREANYAMRLGARQAYLRKKFLGRQIAAFKTLSLSDAMAMLRRRQVQEV
ncbi:MAG: hypothetical protein ABSD12_23840, partial [Paraburkholderia sp.]